MYLLDTHIFLWWLNDDPRLKASARAKISSQNPTVYVSSAVIWEIAIKAKLGKLKAPTNIADYINKSGFEELAITAAHAARTRELPLHHRDPFDRMLIAQAELEGLTIITHDKIFSRYFKSVVIT